MPLARRVSDRLRGRQLVQKCSRVPNLSEEFPRQRWGRYRRFERDHGPDGSHSRHRGGRSLVVAHLQESPGRFRLRHLQLHGRGPGLRHSGRFRQAREKGEISRFEGDTRLRAQSQFPRASVVQEERPKDQTVRRVLRVAGREDRERDQATAQQLAQRLLGLGVAMERGTKAVLSSPVRDRPTGSELQERRVGSGDEERVDVLDEQGGGRFPDRRHQPHVRGREAVGRAERQQDRPVQGRLRKLGPLVHEGSKRDVRRVEKLEKPHGRALESHQLRPQDDPHRGLHRVQFDDQVLQVRIHGPVQLYVHRGSQQPIYRLGLQTADRQMGGERAEWERYQLGLGQSRQSPRRLEIRQAKGRRDRDADVDFARHRGCLQWGRDRDGGQVVHVSGDRRPGRLQRRPRQILLEIQGSREDSVSMGQQHERRILPNEQNLATRQRKLQVFESCRSKEGILFPLRGVQVLVVSEEAAGDRERELGGGRDRWKGSERETGIG